MGQSSVVPAAQDEEDRRDDSEGAQGSLDAATERAQGELETLQAGPTFSIGGVELPRRVLLAMGIFLVVFMIAWMLLWAALGGLGLALGWIVAPAVGAAAVKLYGDRVS